MFVFSEIVLCGLVILAIFFDVAHICNMIVVVIVSSFMRFIKPCDILEENEFKSLCFTTDLDIYGHMNNSRFLRDGDYGRTKLFFQSGLGQTILRQGGSLVLGGSAVRYRKPVTLFTAYTIVTKLVYWDTNAFYTEQKFVRGSDGFVCCVVLAKTSMKGLTTDQAIGGLSQRITKPDCPVDLAMWLECNRLSSEKLKKAS